MKDRREKMYDAITDIDDEIIVKAGAGKSAKKRKIWFSAIAAVLVLAIIGGAIFAPNNSPLSMSAYAVSQAEYPKMAPYPNEMDYIMPNGDVDEKLYEVVEAWQDDILNQRSQLQGYDEGLEGFYEKTIREILAGDNGENKVYSPLNTYIALGMLAELTDGESRRQILDLTGAGDIETLRKQVNAIWNANYCDDGATKNVLASSLWLNSDINFKADTLDIIADTYYASSFQGEMGTSEYDKAMQDWINQQTGGLLKEQASQLEMDKETVLTICSTVQFNAKWNNEFSKSKTERGTFKTPDGEKTCKFMCQSRNQTYYWGDKFAAVSKSFETTGEMWFILPDEGISPEELLNDGQVMEFMFSEKSEWENNKYLEVNMTVPKFDVASDMDLTEAFKALGVEDVFDWQKSDFTPMTDDTGGIIVSKVNHAARVMIDEEGCTAVAYTAMVGYGAAAPPDEEVDFVLDRPFIFVITGMTGMPVFVGIVNYP